MDNFIVSARKYRPVTFESVVGQGHITSTLRNAIARKQLAHAFLFCGPRGVGKTTCARILAKSINCLDPQPNAEPCGKCESCLSFNEGRSFNIHELDAASNNSVEYIRALTEQVRIPPQIGKYSIYIIDEAHMLSSAAFNAFLKTLEEPPAHAIFILATTEKHKIIPTILSRCQIYEFKRIKVEDVVGYLQHISSEEGVTYDDESLHIIAQKADGCMRDALSMYDKVVSFCGISLSFKEVAEALNVLDYDTYFNFVDAVSSGDYATAMIMFDEVLQKGFDTQIFLAGLSAHLRNLLVAKSPQTSPLLEVSGSIAARYTKQAEATAVPFIFDSLNIISQCEGAIRTAVSVRLQGEIAILKLCNLSPIKISGGSLQQSYTLPSITPSVAQPTQTSTPAPVQTPAQTVATAPTTVQPSAPAPQAAEPTMQPQPQTVEQTMPTPTMQPQPQAVQQSMPTLTLTPTATPQPQTRSRLGISINDMVNNSSTSKPVETGGSEEKEPERRISPQEEQSVLEGCKEFADKMQESRPRLSEAFMHASIRDGLVRLVVPNDILKEELLQSKHDIVTELMVCCNSENVDFFVEVDRTAVEVQTAPLRDDDKYKYLASKNEAVVELTKRLDLDFV